MAALIVGFKFARHLTNKTPAILYSATRRSHWNKDFKPAPYPKTEQEREAAAKKYNLLPEEYRPYADDGFGYGDYPNIDMGLGIEAKDTYYPYDYPEHKRNFNEPIPVDVDLYGEDRYSLAEKPRFTNAQYWLSFLGVMSACFAIYYFLEDKKMFRPLLPKQYPTAGKTHYTFEPK